ncbi:MAG: beta-propeller domain-containing protein [Oscillospiraceae bacterium]|nr:beta-propeller domain-containing protein [Oscillospiraceae bacterium]
MQSKRIIKIVLPICLVVIIIGSIFIIGLANRPAPLVDDTEIQGEQTKTMSLPTLISVLSSLLVPEQQIISDGKIYTISELFEIITVKELENEAILPLVGDRETLLKLLLDRGAIYDGDRRDYNGFYYFDLPMAVSSEAEVTFSADMAMEQSFEMGSDEILQPLAVDEGVSFSQTNEQVMGVNEGDVVKTDGEYIYALSANDGSLRIIEANGSQLELSSTISDNGVIASEFYLIGNDRLAIIGSEYVPMDLLPIPWDENNTEDQDQLVPADYYTWYNSRNFTILLIYDISDPTAPTELRRVSMDGWKLSTRVIGDIIYLVTNKTMWSIPYAAADSPSILPYVRDSAKGEEYEPFAYDCIYYIPDSSDTNYLLVGAIDVYSDAPFEPIAYLGAGSNLYMSRNGMYLTKYRYVESTYSELGWRSWLEMTDIMRFTINGTNVVYTGMGTALGSPINQYSMDEHEGYFRIATTDWLSGTYVSIFDVETMETVGITEALAPGERMQSMRFMGDMGYIVTFENLDPLFTIDLSDPYNPKILGELKIPGFSQYLHPVGEGLLLGIGRDTQEIYTRDASGVETVIGFRDVGMKVSLFDVSNPYEPKEIDMLSLGDGWTEVSHNPRALMSDRFRSIYGFTMQNWNNEGGRYSFEALLLNVDEGKLNIAASLNASLQNGNYISIYNSRLCFIENYLYLIHGNGIEVFDYNSYEKINSFVY